MLSVDRLNVYYDTIHAIHNISFEVNEGEIVTLVGANGAGKTTVLHAISGLVPIHSGMVKYFEEAINDIPANRIVERGISHVPEGRRIFANLSVMENLEMGAYSRKDRAGVREDFDRVLAWFPRIKERLKQNAGTLSGGEQQMLAIGRTIMSRPRLILMDEPSMGLSPILVKDIFTIIKHINQAGTTILLVEQNAHMALSIAHRAYVLETGKIVLEDTASHLAHDDKVRKAYLKF